MTWTPIWRQAHTAGLPMGLLHGKGKTTVFRVPVYNSGDSFRVSFLNAFGKKATTVGSMTVLLDGTLYPVTKKGKTSFKIKAGERLYSDEVKADLPAGTELEVRIYMKDSNADTNMTEEWALQYKGDLTGEVKLPEKEKADLLVKNGVYFPVPAIEGIEVHRPEGAKVIAAFGDSITSMNRWVKPLAKRLYDTYGEEYTLVNEGILGNCLTYERPGAIWKMFGEEGRKRVERDFTGLDDLDTVIFALGTNDFSYAYKDLEETLSAEKVIEATEKIVAIWKARGLRVVGQTLSPRFGYPNPPKYNDYMNEQRLKFNEWMRSTGIFDYVFDADEVVRDPKDPNRYDDRYHQGDHLHPNAEGGQLLADSYDLEKLTGKQ